VNNKPRPTQAELERLGRALRTLSGSNRALLRAIDEASLLQDVCRVVAETAGYRGAMVCRAEHDPGQTISVLAEIGFGEDIGDVGALTWSDGEQGQSTTGTAIRTGAPCLVKDVRVRGLAPTWREFARKRGFGSLLSLPLRVEGSVFGSLTIAAPEADAFEDDELRVLTEAADDLAFGLETLRLRQRRQQAEHEIVRLNRALQARAAINLALALTSDEAALLNEICRAVVEECGYRLAWVADVADDEERTLRPMAWAGSHPGDERFVQLRRTWGGTERARRMSATLQGGSPWIVRDIDSDPEYPFHEQAREHHFASMIILPLRVDGALVGSLYILAADVDAFDEKEMQLLTATARDLGYGLGALRARGRAAAAEQEVKRLAHFDPVTGLPNRTRLRELLGDAIGSARAERRPLALLRIESEGFREINEVLGDRELEGLACEIAQRLQTSAGPTGLVARTADGEFAVVLPRAGAEQAMQIAQRVTQALSEPVDSSGLLLDARSSIGISMFPGHGTEPDALLRRASVALNEARRAGAGIALFQEGLDRQHAQRLALMGELRQAIEQDQLLLYCQPKLRIASGQLCGAEALVRWKHPRLGLVQPGEFIKLAESAGLITPLTYWVMDAAMRQSYEWREQGLHQPLSVNLSARDLRDPKLTDRIAGSLTTWGAQPGSIEFELTESALMEDPSGALETLTRLKRLDVDLTIDDYGTGYSSLSYLQRLPVDAIKIDQSFVVNMLRNRDSATIVRSTIELAHNLDLSVIAEGVEDRNIFDQLAELGCDIAQGFCIGHPIPVDQFRMHRAGPGPASALPG
jgi:diguanylate cyclase (GGDEF)-like protein